MTKRNYNSNWIKKADERQKEEQKEIDTSPQPDIPASAEVIPLSNSDDDLKTLNAPIVFNYKPSRADLINYIFKFGIHKGKRGTDVLMIETTKQTSKGVTYNEKTGVKYIKYLLSTIDLYDRDRAILKELLRQYYVTYKSK